MAYTEIDEDNLQYYSLRSNKSARLHLKSINQKNGFEIASIRTLFPKDNIEWLNWINQGKMIYGNKEKLQALIAQQRMNVADVNKQFD